MGLILDKNALRTIKKRPLQSLSITALIMLASLLFVSLTYAFTNVEDAFYNYRDNYNQEEFSFMMNPFLTEEEVQNIIEEYNLDVNNDFIPFEIASLDELGYGSSEEIYTSRINELESEYDIDLEIRRYKQVHIDFNDNEVLVQFMNNMQTINKTYLEDGKFPTSNNEIAINIEFALANNLKLNDKFTIEDTTYKIVGFILFPDYVYPMLTDDNFLISNSTQVLALTSEEVFNDINAFENLTISGMYTNENTTKDDLQHDYITFLKDSRENMRTGAIYSDIEGNKLMTYYLAGFILILSVLMIGLVVNKSITNDRKQIGVIKAMGYKNIELARGYLLMALIVTLVGTILGFILGYFLGEPMVQMYNDYYLIPESSEINYWILILGGIIAPVALVMLLSWVIIMLIVNKNPLKLIKEQKKEKVSFMSKLTNKLLKKRSFKTRFKYTFALNSTGKIMVTFVGLLIASIYMVFSVITIKAMDEISGEFIDNVDYNYQTIYQQFLNDDLDGDDFTVTNINLGKINKKTVDEDIYLYGINSDNELLRLYDSEKNDITTLLDDSSNGAVITNLVAVKLGVEVGDEIIFTTISGEEEELIVKGITNSNMQFNIYMSKETVNGYFELDNDFYNGRWSLTASEDHSDLVASKVSNVQMQENLQSMMKIANYSLWLFVVISAVIALIVLVLMGNYTIDDNFKAISLLKIFGYTKKEISNMVTSIYFPLVIITFLLAIPITLSAYDEMMKELVTQLNFSMPLVIDYGYLFISFVIFVATYYLSLYLSNRKLDKISLQEAIKLRD